MLARQLAARGFSCITDDEVKRMLALDRAQRWKAFSDEEIRVIYVEMVTDDCQRYGYDEGDEPAYTIYCELIAEIKRRGIDEIT